jgi:hypothetical protein
MSLDLVMTELALPRNVFKEVKVPGRYEGESFEKI